MTVNIPSTGDNTAQAQSTTVTIPNLKSVDAISVNTGTVTKSVSGNTITINCSGGASVRSSQSTPSQPANDSRTSGSNSFPSSIPYNSGGYSGTLYTNGLSFVASGSYYPGDSKTATGSQSCTVSRDYTYLSGGWTATSGVYNNAPGSIPYNSGGYSGTLSLTSVSGNPPAKTGSGTLGDTVTMSTAGTASYSGTVSSPSSDTRVWQQNYSGTVYGTPVTTYYYAYVVTLTYTDTVKLGTVNYKTPNGIISLPVYDLTMTLPIARIKLPSAIGCFELLPVNDARASNVRIMTQYGLKAIGK